MSETDPLLPPPGYGSAPKPRSRTSATQTPDISDRSMTSIQFLSLILNTVCSLMNFIIMDAIANPDGTYPFKWMNLQGISAAIATLFSYSQSKRPFQSVTLKSVTLQILLGMINLIANYILIPMGLELTSVPFSVGMTLAPHPMCAAIRALFDGKTSSTANVFIIGGATTQIIGYLLYMALFSAGFSVLGFIILFLAGLMNSLFNVVVMLFVGEDSQEPASSGSVWESMFLNAIGRMIAAFALIPAECFLLDGSFIPMDMIPGYNFSRSSFCCAIFFAIFAISAVFIGSYDAGILNVSNFTGIIGSSLLSSGLIHFKGFDIVGFVMTVGIYFNAISYVFSYQDTLTAQNMNKIISRENEISSV